MEASYRRDFAEEILELFKEAGTATQTLPTAGLDGIKLTRPLVTLDLEATDREPGRARIIEVGAVKLNPDGTRDTFNRLVYPGLEISPEIEDLTGITNQDLETAADFAQIGPLLFEFLKDCDLAGYGLRNYDVPLLWEEFFRIGVDWEVPKVRLDVGNLFKIHEPRTLSAASIFYLGEEHEGAHRAWTDAKRTEEILDAQIRRYPDLPGTIEEIAALSVMDRRVDLAGKIILSEQGEPVFNFGSKKGEAVQAQKRYATWVASPETDFPEQTKQVIRALIAE